MPTILFTVGAKGGTGKSTGGIQLFAKRTAPGWSWKESYSRLVLPSDRLGPH